MLIEGPAFSLYTQATMEDRCAPRTRVNISATLRQSGGRSVQTMVRDLSVSGFSASSINRMHPGSVCWLTLPGLESLQSEVVWWNNSIVGGAFANLLSPVVLENLLFRWPINSAFRTVT